MVSDLKKKYLVLAMASCLSLMVFTGCGNKNGNNDMDNATSAPTTEEATASPEATDGVMDDMEDFDISKK